MTNAAHQVLLGSRRRRWRPSVGPSICPRGETACHVRRGQGILRSEPSGPGRRGVRGGAPARHLRSGEIAALGEDEALIAGRRRCRGDLLGPFSSSRPPSGASWWRASGARSLAAFCSHGPTGSPAPSETPAAAAPKRGHTRPCQDGELEAMVLSNPRIELSSLAAGDVAAGRIDLASSRCYWSSRAVRPRFGGSADQWALVLRRRDDDLEPLVRSGRRHLGHRRTSRLDLQPGGSRRDGTGHLTSAAAPSRRARRSVAHVPRGREDLHAGPPRPSTSGGTDDVGTESREDA